MQYLPTLDALEARTDKADLREHYSQFASAVLSAITVSAESTPATAAIADETVKGLISDHVAHCSGFC